MDKYHKETVVLETIEGTAHSKEELIEVWEKRIKDNFSHYKLISSKYEKEKGRDLL